MFASNDFSSKQLSNGYMRVGTPPILSPDHGSATKPEKSNRFNRLNIWHKIFMFHANSRVKLQVRLHVISYVRICYNSITY